MKTPEKLENFMYGLMKEAKRDSLVEFLANWGIDYNIDYPQIKEWFKSFGIIL